MVLDHRRAYEIARALMRARNGKDGGNILENVTQTGLASDDGSYGELVFGGMGFPSASRLGVATGGNTTNQSRKLSPTPLYPFSDPAKLSYTGEAADMAKARGIPAHDQLAFSEVPSTSLRPANLQTIYGRPLAVNAAGASQQRYWNYLWEKLFPSYCPSTDDNPTFPPLINQVDEGDNVEGEKAKADKIERDKAACHDQFERDEDQCYESHSYNSDVLRQCRDRAKIIRDLCLRGKKEVSPWNDFDTDGVKLPKPPKRWKLK